MLGIESGAFCRCHFLSSGLKGNCDLFLAGEQCVFCGKEFVNSFEPALSAYA